MYLWFCGKSAATILFYLINHELSYWCLNHVFASQHLMQQKLNKNKSQKTLLNAKNIFKLAQEMTLLKLMSFVQIILMNQAHAFDMAKLLRASQ